jgi:hypothetical protein
LKDQTYQARVAALSIVQSMTVVNLLRAHGQDEHAENVEAAISTVVAIVSNALGRDTLSQAMRWASDKTGTDIELFEPTAARH